MEIIYTLYKGKISKAIALLYKVKDSLDNKALYILYNTMIVPYLTYCIEVWGNACKTYTQSIFILQKRAIRLISRKQYRDPTNPLFLQLKVLKFQELVDYSIVQIMQKAHKKTLPINIQKRFEKRESKYNLKGTEIFKNQDLGLN